MILREEVVPISLLLYFLLKPLSVKTVLTAIVKMQSLRLFFESLQIFPILVIFFFLFLHGFFLVLYFLFHFPLHTPNFSFQHACYFGLVLRQKALYFL